MVGVVVSVSLVCISAVHSGESCRPQCVCLAGPERNSRSISSGKPGVRMASHKSASYSGALVLVLCAFTRASRTRAPDLLQLAFCV